MYPYEDYFTPSNILLNSLQWNEEYCFYIRLQLSADLDSNRTYILVLLTTTQQLGNQFQVFVSGPSSATFNRIGENIYMN